MLWGGGVTYQCGQCDNMYIKGGQWQCMLHNGIISMQKIKRFIKDIPFKRVLICKTIQKGSKSWNSSQIWLFFKTYKCIFKTQNSWHFFCYTDTVCCLQNLFQLGWLGTRQAYYKINVAIAASCSKFLGQILYDFEGMLAYRIDIKGFLAVQNSSIGDLVTHWLTD